VTARSSTGAFCTASITGSSASWSAFAMCHIVAGRALDASGQVRATPPGLTVRGVLRPRGAECLPRRGQ
jgi:hypothetical protein